MAKSIVALAAASCLAVLTAGGTYALLNSSATAGSGATITSGTAALTVSPLGLSTTLYPGLTIYAPVTVTNSGQVPLSTRIAGLTAPTASTIFAQSLSVGVGVAASAAACQAGSVTSTWSGTFASNSPASIGPALPVGGSVILCVALTLPIGASSAAQGQSATSFGVRLDGDQA
ncbi:MAG: hypothetical protein ABIX44_01885 [Cryobacterium sp.]